MKIETVLDYRRISANDGRPVFFAVRIVAPSIEAEEPPPRAIAIVFAPSAETKRLARGFVRHCPDNAELALIVCGEVAETMHALGPIADRAALAAFVSELDEASGDVAFASGWLLALAELRKVSGDFLRRIILIASGRRDDERLARLIREGAGQGVETRVVGAGAEWRTIAAELGGLRPVTLHNVRVRLRPGDFCDGIEPFGGRSSVEGAWTEVCAGDFVDREEKTICFNLNIPVLPCCDGKPIATFDGEALAELEVSYDAVTASGIESRRFEQTIFARSEQSPGATSRTATLLAGNLL